MQSSDSSKVDFDQESGPEKAASDEASVINPNDNKEDGETNVIFL